MAEDITYSYTFVSYSKWHSHQGSKKLDGTPWQAKEAHESEQSNNIGREDRVGHGFSFPILKAAFVLNVLFRESAYSRSIFIQSSPISDINFLTGSPYLPFCALRLTVTVKKQLSTLTDRAHRVSSPA